MPSQNAVPEFENVPPLFVDQWLETFFQEALTYPYRYAWGPRGFGTHRGFDRKGQFCRIVKRCALNTAVVQFEDGCYEVISRNALRKRRPGR